MNIYSYDGSNVTVCNTCYTLCRYLDVSINEEATTYYTHDLDTDQKIEENRKVWNSEIESVTHVRCNSDDLEHYYVEKKISIINL